MISLESLYVQDDGALHERSLETQVRYIGDRNDHRRDDEGFNNGTLETAKMQRIDAVLPEERQERGVEQVNAVRERADEG